jgi:hypothetical protein
MTNDQIVAKLEKTRKSIAAHRERGLGLGERGNINTRGCDLCDRYDDLRKMLTETDREGYAAWKAYCDRHEADYRHDGHDMFA